MAVLRQGLRAALLLSATTALGATGNEYREDHRDHGRRAPASLTHTHPATPLPTWNFLHILKACSCCCLALSGSCFRMHWFIRRALLSGRGYEECTARVSTARLTSATHCSQQGQVSTAKGCL